MKNQLTERQQEILQFIQNYLYEVGYPPTIREIARHFGMSSTFGVKKHLDALVKKGYLNIESNASRGISFLKSEFLQNRNTVSVPEETNKIPIVGRVAAGSPILAEQNIEGSVVVDPSFTGKSKDCFALKVKGDSMINAGIFEGDLVIVSSAVNAVNGDIVVAMLSGEVTVKTFRKKNNKILLIPENDSYKPIEVQPEQEFAVLGKVVGVVRWIN